MKKSIIFIIVGLVVVVIVVLVVINKPGYQSSNTVNTINTNTASGTSTQATNPAQTFRFSDPKKSAHYESNTPAHGSILPAPPVNVVLDFNFDLATVSTISITKDGKEYSTGSTTIDANKLAMRRTMDMNAPDGLYTVSYNACWPDGSCHDGNFQFAIDQTRAASFEDMRGQTAVTIHMKAIAFEPRNIRISKGTTVTWVNDESDIHYVNTDAHPSHTYYTAQNSNALSKGDTFALTFDKPGAYPSHCSAHADRMTAMILVE